MDNQAFKKVKEKLEQSLSVYGSVECVEHVSDDDYLSYDVCLNIESDDPALYCVEVYVSSTGAFQLAKQSLSFYVEELEELEKMISIFYGSPFSLNIQRIQVLWPRYLIEVPLIERCSLGTMKEKSGNRGRKSSVSDFFKSHSIIKWYYLIVL